MEFPIGWGLTNFNETLMPVFSSIKEGRATSPVQPGRVGARLSIARGGVN
jgi:hypothetical protein